MEILSFLAAPFIGGLIALSTNWLAIRMLFRPHKEKRLFGIKIPFTPGLIPKERLRITAKLASTISTKLLSPKVLAKELANPEVWPLPDITVGEALSGLNIELFKKGHFSSIFDKLIPMVSNEILLLSEKYPLLDEKLRSLTENVIRENVGGIAGMFIKPDKIYRSIKSGMHEYLSDTENQNHMKEKLLLFAESDFLQDVLADKVLNVNIKNVLLSFIDKEKQSVENVLAKLAGYFAEHMPVQAMIENKIAEFDMAEVEEIILSVTGKELRVIVLLGGVLGFIIGLMVSIF